MSGSVCLEKNLNIILGLGELVGVWWLSWLGGYKRFYSVVSGQSPRLPPIGNLYISIHPCRSVCDCSGVTAAADVMNIFVSLQKAPTVGPRALFANSPAVGLRCSLSTTNETL